MTTAKPGPPAGGPKSQTERIKRLEEDNRLLQQRVRELEHELEDIKREANARLSSPIRRPL